MDSQFFKYSRRANPLILLFLGIVGVIWGSTFFMGVILFVGLGLAVYDTVLRSDDARALGISGTVFKSTDTKSGVTTQYILAPKKSDTFNGNQNLVQSIEKILKTVGIGIIAIVLFGAFGFGLFIIYASYSLVRYLFALRSNLKQALLEAPKLP